MRPEIVRPREPLVGPRLYLPVGDAHDHSCEIGCHIGPIGPLSVCATRETFEWRNLVARRLREPESAGSSPVSETSIPM